MAPSLSKMSEEQQWAAAARMLETHGDLVGELLLDHIRSLIRAGEHDEVKTWVKIADKAQRLYGPEGGDQ
jgi:hypothetical protein